MKPYATYKYVILVLAILFGALYATPNIYGEDPAVQVTLESGEALPPDFGDRVDKALKLNQVTPVASQQVEQQWVVRLADETQQLKAAEALTRELGRGHVVALNLAPRTPDWLRKLGAKPMALGLDLRGGVHLLLEVDVDDMRKHQAERLTTDLPAFLRKQDIRYSGRRQSTDGSAAIIEFADAEKLEAARKAIAKEFAEVALTVPPDAPLTLEARISDAENKAILDRAVAQNLITLRNRVNQLGVAEPVVQRQGPNRIVMQLPGVQDPGQVKVVLGSVATLEYRAVSEEDANAAAATGIVPPGTQLYYHRDGRRPVLLKKEIIASGSELIDAAATVDQDNQPAASVRLDSAGGKRMLEFTSKNLHKPMAVLFKDRKARTNYNAEGQPIREVEEIEEVISIATIQGVFGNKFQTTGLSSKEAHDLSLLLKSGALAAPVDIVEERTVGPSLGADNIRQGFQAAVLGLALVAAFMIFYYRAFGFFAVSALLVNLLLVVAVLSLLQATLTMPGIAGIVLHMGIAVDANVLIYERIREELRNGMKPHAAIEAGYDRAFLTIADANVTVLIGTIVLFALGAGPVKGFAITLSIGILSSQFTAIVGSRALAQLFFAKRQMKDVPVW